MYKCTTCTYVIIEDLLMYVSSGAPGFMYIHVYINKFTVLGVLCLLLCLVVCLTLLASSFLISH